MRLPTSLALIGLAPLLLALAGPYNQKDPAQAAEPKYDTTTHIDVMMVVAEVKEVADGPLNGMHLIARPETARANSETTDVYLGPDDYMKEMDCHFAKGDRVEVLGSKVKFNGAATVLAREVRHENTTVVLRDDHGVPYWKKS